MRSAEAARRRPTLVERAVRALGSVRSPGPLGVPHVSGGVLAGRRLARIPALTIRTRLALWFALMTATGVIALSFAVMQLTHDGLLSELRRDVRQRTNELAAVVAPDFLAGFGQSRVLDVFSQLDVYCQVVYPNGVLAATGPNLDGLRLPFRASPVEIQSEQIVGKIPLIVDQQPVYEPGSRTIAGYAIVGRSPASIYAALSRLRGVLYPAGAIAIALGGLGGWLVVRRAIRPLDRVGRAAAAIAASRDHGLRVAYRGGNDEIGRLAVAIDEMLAALDDAHGRLESVHADLATVHAELERAHGGLAAAHADLEAAHAALETAHAGQRQFLLDVSHELRTPLTVMLASLDVLARTGSDDPAFVSRTLDGLHAETDRMRRMVVQLLILARSDTETPLTREPVAVAGALRAACGEIRAGAQLTVDERSLRRLEGVMAEADPDYLRQLFLILLDNAAKYTPEGGAIHVSAAVRPGSVSVEVRDNGIGIPPDELPQVFERFYRGSNARGIEGSGLGLAIARRIAGMHGGSVEVRSRQGRGTVFTVTLPATVPARSAGARRLGGRAAAHEAKASG